MSDWTELKRLAEEAVIARPVSWYTQDDCCWWTGNADEGDFIAAANPKTILALIAENERLSEELSACTEFPGGCGYWREAARHREAERDQLRAEVEALRKDAERYRWLRAHHGLSLKGHDFISYGEVADFRVDNAMTVVKADG